MGTYYTPSTRVRPQRIAARRQREWMCVIARDDEIEDFEWYDDASVDTTGLHIPSSTAVEHGTPVYSEDRRAPEWELAE